MYVKLHVHKKTAAGIRERLNYSVFECDIVNCEFISFRLGVALYHFG